MKVAINNPKLVDILKQREEVFKSIYNINEKLMKLDSERKKFGYKMEALKEKTKVIIDKMDIKLEEFEFISRVYLEKGMAYYDIENMIEEYKKSLREEAKKKK